jgi:hypothetical protein
MTFLLKYFSAAVNLYLSDNRLEFIGSHVQPKGPLPSHPIANSSPFVAKLVQSTATLKPEVDEEPVSEMSSAEMWATLDDEDDLEPGFAVRSKEKPSSLPAPLARPSSPRPPAPFHFRDEPYEPMMFPYGLKEWRSLTASRKESFSRRYIEKDVKPNNAEYTRKTGKLPPPEFREPFDIERLADYMFQLQGEDDPFALERTPEIRGKSRRPPREDDEEEPAPSSRNNPEIDSAERGEAVQIVARDRAPETPEIDAA